MRQLAYFSFRLFLPVLMNYFCAVDAVIVLPSRSRLPPFGWINASHQNDFSGLNTKLVPVHQPFKDRGAVTKGNLESSAVSSTTPGSGDERSNRTSTGPETSATNSPAPQTTTPKSPVAHLTATSTNATTRTDKFVRFSTRIKGSKEDGDAPSAISMLENSTSENSIRTTGAALDAKLRVNSGVNGKNSTVPKTTPNPSATTGKSTNPTVPKTTVKPRVRRIRIFQLTNASYPADSEVKLSSDFYPGLQSGNVVVPVQNVPKPVFLKFGVNVTADASKGRSCTSHRERARGFCFPLADVLFGRSCANLSATIVEECNGNEVCCFEPNSNRRAAEAYDNAPCGLRRTANTTGRSIENNMFKDFWEDDLEPEGRIVNGVRAAEGEICWQAAIMVDSAYACGGAIINSQNVITVAHCVQDVDDVKRFRVRFGHRNVKVRKQCLESFEVSQVIFHDLYDPSTFAFDLAILKLSAPITNVNCSCLACLPEVPKDRIKDEDCIVSGYGTTQPNSSSTTGSGILNVGQVSLVENSSDCSQRFRTAPEVDQAFDLDSSMLCTIGSDTKKLADTCDLDSGSPLTCTLRGGAANAYTLVGVSSWGLPCGTNDNTLHPQQASIPSVYSDVRKSIDWIREAISNFTSVS